MKREINIKRQIKGETSGGLKCEKITVSGSRYTKQNKMSINMIKSMLVKQFILTALMIMILLVNPLYATTHTVTFTKEDLLFSEVDGYDQVPLGGNSDLIPVRYSYIYHYDNHHNGEAATDLYYANCMVGDEEWTDGSSLGLPLNNELTLIADANAVINRGLDGDGCGNSDNLIQDCTISSWYVETDDDCDDNDPNTYPGAREICDGKDNNCDGLIDEPEDWSDNKIITTVPSEIQHGPVYISVDTIGGPSNLCRFTIGFDQISRYRSYYPLYRIEENTKTISIPSDIVGSPCEQVTIPLEVDDAAGIAGVDLVLGFDPDVLIPMDAKLTSLTQGFIVVVNDTVEGRLIISLASAVGITEGSGALANLIFKVHPEAQEPDSTVIIFHSVHLYDENVKPIEPITFINGQFTVQGEGCCCIVEKELTGKWNMVSLLVEPENTLASDIFPDAKVIYSFKKGYGYIRVKPNEEMEPGDGYWLLLPKARSYKLLGDCIQEYTLPIENGWYLIGSCSTPAKASVNTGSIDVIYRYDPGFGYKRLLESEMLMPGSGYWILLSNIPDQSQAILKIQGTGSPSRYKDESHIDNANVKRRMKSTESQDGQWRLGITATGHEYQGASNVSSICIGMDNNAATYPSPGYLPNYTVDMRVSEGFLEDIREKGSEHEVWNLIVEIDTDADDIEEDYYPVLSWNPADIGAGKMEIRRGDTEAGEILVDDMRITSTYQTHEQDGYYDPDSGKTFLFYMVVFKTTDSEFDYNHDNICSTTNAYWDHYGNLNRWNSVYMPYLFGVYSEPRFLSPYFYNTPYAYFDCTYDNYYTSVLRWQPFLNITEDQKNDRQPIWIHSWIQPFPFFLQ